MMGVGSHPGEVVMDSGKHQVGGRWGMRKSQKDRFLRNPPRGKRSRRDRDRAQRDRNGH